MKTLYVAWQDPKNLTWFPVGALKHYTKENKYTFSYVRGALESKSFSTFGRMTDLYTTYESEELFPLFKNRLLHDKRPEYQEYIEWLNITDDENTPFMQLSRSGGIRGTDSIELFPKPEKTIDNKFNIIFFNHGLRHFSEQAIKRVDHIAPGEKLYLMKDMQNRFDSNAMAIRAENPPILLGYCPRYLAKDLNDLFIHIKQDEIDLVAKRVNSNAPTQLRLLLELTSPWPDGFNPCSGRLYEPLTRKS